MAKGNQRKVDHQPMFFSAFNYRLIGGFTAMLVENEVEGIISLYISPIVILAGFIVVIFAIMKHDRDDAPTADQDSV